MTCSPARLEANRKNAARSCGPKTPEGKARSRANALKHGLTGAGVVLAEGDAAEVDRLAAAFQRELEPEGEAGAVLARRMAVHAVRMDRCATEEMAIPARFEEALAADRTSPYVPNAEALRAEAIEALRREASEAAERLRRHAAAAERGFLRAIKELRQLRSDAAEGPSAASASPPPVALASPPPAALGSISPAALVSPTTPAPVPARAPIAALAASSPSSSYVPISIGRPR